MIGPEQLGVIVAALISAGAVFYTNKVTKAANTKSAELQAQHLALEQRTVDRQAYDRARQIDMETINGLRRDVSSERDVVEGVRRELADERRENGRLRDEVRECRAEIARLRRKLAMAGLLDDRSGETPQPPNKDPRQERP